MSESSRPFRDREHAGRILAQRLSAYADRDDAIVLALPRGGVPVGAEVATTLRLPLDVFVVRKLGTPGHEELAMGAIASGGVRVLNEDVVQALGIPDEAIEREARREAEELERRERLYRGDRPPLDLTGLTVLLVDDGLATGSTMRAAIQAVRQHGPSRIVVAVPVGAEEICQDLRRQVDEMVCLEMPYPFYAVGLWYERFAQTSDEEVRDLLAQHRHPVKTREPKA